MAYSKDKEKRINYYSAPHVMFKGHPTGTEDNDNARALTEVRFAVANIGDEAMECPAEVNDKALDTDCRDKFRSCFLTTSSCWDPLVAAGCSSSCGLCPGMSPLPSTACYDKVGDCEDLVEIVGCQNNKVLEDCRKECGACV